MSVGDLPPGAMWPETPEGGKWLVADKWAYIALVGGPFNKHLGVWSGYTRLDGDEFGAVYGVRTTWCLDDGTPVVSAHTWGPTLPESETVVWLWVPDGGWPVETDR